MYKRQDLSSSQSGTFLREVGVSQCGLRLGQVDQIVTQRRFVGVERRRRECTQSTASVRDTQDGLIDNLTRKDRVGRQSSILTGLQFVKATALATGTAGVDAANANSSLLGRNYILTQLEVGSTTLNREIDGRTCVRVVRLHSNIRIENFVPHL